MLLMEMLQIVGGVRPVDLSTGANDGDWVSLKNYRKIIVLMHSTIGTSADDPTLTIEQASAVAGTGAKALDFTRIYTKQAATDLLAVGTWTLVTQAAANTYTEATSAEQEALWAVEFDADELDVDNDFDCVRGRVADIGTNAQLGAIYYILGMPRYRKAPQNMLSAIID